MRPKANPVIRHNRKHKSQFKPLEEFRKDNMKICCDLRRDPDFRAMARGAG